MTFELDGENPPGVLSEAETCRRAPLYQCDVKSCSDGISMKIATKLFMYQVDYNFIHTVIDSTEWATP